MSVKLCSSCPSARMDTLEHSQKAPSLLLNLCVVDMRFFINVFICMLLCGCFVPPCGQCVSSVGVLSHCSFVVLNIFAVVL